MDQLNVMLYSYNSIKTNITRYHSLSLSTNISYCYLTFYIILVKIYMKNISSINKNKKYILYWNIININTNIFIYHINSYIYQIFI